MSISWLWYCAIVFQFIGGTGSTVHKICIVSYHCICSYNLFKINLLVFKLINLTEFLLGKTSTSSIKSVNKSTLNSAICNMYNFKLTVITKDEDTWNISSTTVIPQDMSVTRYLSVYFLVVPCIVSFYKKNIFQML